MVNATRRSARAAGATPEFLADIDKTFKRFASEATRLQTEATMAITSMREYHTRPDNECVSTPSFVADQRPSDCIIASIRAIEQDLLEDPIESGMAHSAEQLLAQHLLRYNEEGLFWAVRNNRPSASADFLKILGRSTCISSQLRKQLVAFGLASDSLALRDAAVQAVDNWEDGALVGILREHREPIAWLQQYAIDVAVGLGG